MIGSICGTDESPGEVFLSNGRTYKSYRGSSIAAVSGRLGNGYFQKKYNIMINLCQRALKVECLIEAR